MNASGAAGGLKDADANPSASASVLLPIADADAVKVANDAGTGTQGREPSVYLTSLANVFPLELNEAIGTSVARLNRRTFDSVLGGTKLAAIISRLSPSVGGQLPPFPGGGPFGGPPVSAITSGPGVRNFVAVKRVFPPDLTSTWPLPTANLVIQPLNCENL